MRNEVGRRQPVITPNILDTIGNTPLVRLNRVAAGSTARWSRFSPTRGTGTTPNRGRGASPPGRRPSHP